MMLPLIWLKVVTAAAYGASTEPVSYTHLFIARLACFSPNFFRVASARESVAPASASIPPSKKPMATTIPRLAQMLPKPEVMPFTKEFRSIPDRMPMATAAEIMEKKGFILNRTMVTKR